MNINQVINHLRTTSLAVSIMAPLLAISMAMVLRTSEYERDTLITVANVFIFLFGIITSVLATQVRMVLGQLRATLDLTTQACDAYQEELRRANAKLDAAGERHE